MPVHSRRSVAIIAAIVLLIALAITLLSAKSAAAGSYTVTECSSLNPTPGEASWERISPHYEQRSRCGSGEGLQVFHNASQSSLWQFGAWVWRAPFGTVFTDIQANASLAYQAGHRGQLIATRPGGELVEFGDEHTDFRVHSLEGEFVQFHSWLRCVAPGAGQPCGRAGDDSAHAYVRGLYLRTEDRSVPVLSLSGGSLLADPVVRGARGLDFSAFDFGSGIRKVFVEANGALVSTDIRNCAVVDGFATALSPCPLSTSEPTSVNSAAAAFATGPNTVTACVEDLALDGAANRACERRQVWVDNACPGSPVGGGTTLAAGFAPGGATGVTRSDKRGLIRGSLSGFAGPLAGATVCALTQTHIDGAPIVVGSTATTAADGSYALELPPGPSRNVFVHYVSGDSVVARHGLVLAAPARPTLRVRPRHRARRGKRLHFDGELPAPACFDRVVKVQARIGKRRWQVFRTDRADESCRFSARYKLRATERAKLYRFRALVPQQSGYPYLRGTSALAKVEVG